MATLVAHQTKIVCTLLFHQQIIENSRAGISIEERITWFQVTTGFTLALGLHPSKRGLGTAVSLALIIVSVVWIRVVIQSSKVSERDLYLSSVAACYGFLLVLAYCDRLC